MNSFKRVRTLQIELEFGNVGFFHLQSQGKAPWGRGCWLLRRGEKRSTRRKTSRSKGENQQQTQPTYGVDAGSETRATLVGGERSHHFRLRHPCSAFARGFPRRGQLF